MAERHMRFNPDLQGLVCDDDEQHDQKNMSCLHGDDLWMANIIKTGELPADRSSCSLLNCGAALHSPKGLSLTTRSTPSFLEVYPSDPLRYAGQYLIRDRLPPLGQLPDG